MLHEVWGKLSEMGSHASITSICERIRTVEVDGQPEFRNDNYTIELSAHQARGLNAALTLVKQPMETPPGTPVDPNLGDDGIERTLVKDEFLLLHEVVLSQFESQDKT